MILQKDFLLIKSNKINFFKMKCLLKKNLQKFCLNKNDDKLNSNISYKMQQYFNKFN